jgi:hypothetical protein
MSREITISSAKRAFGDALPVPNSHLSKQSRLSKSEKAWAMLPLWIWVVAIALAIWGSSSANPILTPVAILILVGSAQLLWRRGEPPVLIFACAMQWLQAAAIIFYADFYRSSVEEAGGSRELEIATWLSLIAVFVLALGMRLALIRCSRSQHNRLRSEVLRVNVGNAFVAYVIGFLIAIIAERLAFFIPAITQLIYALITLKWVAVFIVAYTIVEQRQGYLFLVGIVLVEMAVGLLGFFQVLRVSYLFCL